MVEEEKNMFDKHELILSDHAAKLLALEEADKRLAAVDERLEEDIRGLKQQVSDGFRYQKEQSQRIERDQKEQLHRIERDQKEQLHRIESEAFRSIPGNLANQIAVHGLVWQAIGVVSAIILTGMLIYVTIHR